MASSVGPTLSFIPPSVNWYCSKVCDVNSKGLLAYGSRGVLVLLKLSGSGDGLEAAAAFEARHEASISAHKETRVTGVCFSPRDSSLLASVGEDLSVNITDVDARKTTLLHDKHLSKPTCVAWAQTQGVVDFVVSGDVKGTVVICNVSSKKTKCWAAGAKAPVTCIAGCPHAPHLVAVGYKNGWISLMDLHQDGSAVSHLRNHDGEIQSLCWAPFDGAGHWAKDFGTDKDYSPDSEKVLASGSSDGTIKVWSTERGMPFASFVPPTSVLLNRKWQGPDKKSGTWITVDWPSKKPDILVCGSHTGVLLTMELRSGGQNRWKVLGPKDNKNHSRNIFSVACYENVACTISMDKQIIFWKIDGGSDAATRLYVLPCLGGFVYSLSFSPVNSGLVALACGDNAIRTWNVTTAGNSYDVSLFWQGIKSKVTAICWHPRSEGILAYGTAEGRVGIYNVLTFKPPVILKCFHLMTVYAISWGPSCPTRDRSEYSEEFVLYSCGNGVINVHDPSATNKTAVNLEKLIPNSSPKIVKAWRSEISWSSSYEFLSIANSDGSVEVYSAVDLKCLLVLASQSKLVHCVRWHPEYTFSSLTRSRYRFWIAVATQGSVVYVHDLGAYLDGSAATEHPVTLTSCTTLLEGHSSSVASAAWNPHLDAQLATASFDNTVRVWDAAEGRTTACFSNHMGRVLCAAWNPLDPDVVYSGGEDFTLQSWNVTEQDDKPSARVLEEAERQRKKQAQRKKPKKPSAPNPDSDNGKTSTSEGSFVLDESVEELLEQRRKQLAAQSAEREEEPRERPRAERSPPEAPKADPKKKVEEDEGEEEEGEDVSRADSGTGQKPKAGKKKKRRNEKSLFPITSGLENRGKAHTLEDCVALTDKLTGGSKGPRGPKGDDGLNLGLYGDKVAAYKLLKVESENHVATGNLDYAIQLEIWKGNVSGALKMAAKNEQLSDWLVSLAVSVSPSFWSEMCTLYVEQLVGCGYPQKAVTYLLAQNMVHAAVDILKHHVSYKEAVVLAKIRLPPNDPLTRGLIDEWAAQYDKEGNAEHAAKCYLAAGNHDKAALVLGQKDDPCAVRAAAYIAARFRDSVGASAYSTKGIFGCMLNADFETAEELLREHPRLKPYSYVVRAFRLLREFFLGDEEGLLDLDFATLKKMFDDARKGPLVDEVSALASGPNQLRPDGDPGLDLEECEQCLKLCPAMPVPKQESHIVPWIAVMLTLGCVDLVKEKPVEFVRRAVAIFAVLHKSSKVPWLVRFGSLVYPLSDFGADLTTIISSEQKLPDRNALTAEDVETSFNAYMGLVVVHRFAADDEKLERGMDRSGCVFGVCPVEAAVKCLLSEERAELSLLKTRLTYVKVAMASVAASRRRAAAAQTASSPVEEPQTEVAAEEKPDVDKLAADALIQCPGITTELLRVECDRVEAEISRIADKFWMESFPDPLDSAVLVAEFCFKHHNRCGCEDSSRLSKTAVDFGKRFSTLDRQTAKFDSLRIVAV